MTDPKPATPDHEILVLQGRITLALQRISAGYAPMRIPAQLTDPDLVLSDCAARIAADEETVRKQAEEIERLKAQVQVGHDVIRDFDAKIDEARAQVETLREALADIKAKADFQIPPYAYGDNEAACDMAHRLTQIVSIAEAATEPKG